MSEPFGPPRPPAPTGGVTTPERPAATRAPDLTRPAPRSPDDDPTVEIAIVLDKQDTIELAAAELHEAARAAGVPVALPDGAVAPGPDAGQEAERELTDEELASLDPMDPRMRERRIAVTRAEGRRRLRILLGAVALATLLGIGWLVVQSPLLAVDEVTVRGTAHETVDAVRAAAGVSPGDALLFVDTGAVARRVERLPWVASAKVSRELPNGVTITVAERSPVAWLRRPSAPGAPADSGPAALVDATGRVLGDLPGPPPGLPELTDAVGLAATGHELRRPGFAAAVAELPATLRAQVASIGEERGSAVLQLAPAPGAKAPVAREVRLGSLDEIRAKGAAALAVLDQIAIARQRVTYIDVRVPGAPATR